jgi:hypothetical protein
MEGLSAVEPTGLHSAIRRAARCAPARHPHGQGLQQQPLRRHVREGRRVGQRRVQRQHVLGQPVARAAAAHARAGAVQHQHGGPVGRGLRREAEGGRRHEAAGGRLCDWASLGQAGVRGLLGLIGAPWCGWGSAAGCCEGVAGAGPCGHSPPRPHYQRLQRAGRRVKGAAVGGLRAAAAEAGEPHAWQTRLRGPAVPGGEVRPPAPQPSPPGPAWPPNGPTSASSHTAPSAAEPATREAGSVRW